MGTFLRQRLNSTAFQRSFFTVQNESNEIQNSGRCTRFYL